MNVKNVIINLKRKAEREIKKINKKNISVSVKNIRSARSKMSDWIKKNINEDIWRL